MSISCMIVDDEPFARDLLTDYVQKVPFLQLVATCSNPLEAINLLRDRPVELLFLDVQMPEVTGITMLKILQDKPLVILTTAYSEYALDSYEFDTVDYLLKPITFERFLRAVEKARRRILPSSALSSEKELPHSEPSSAFVFVKDGTKLVKIRWDDILYIEGMKDYVAVHTKQQRVVSLLRLKELEEQLPAEKFARIHHSYIVAIQGIDAVHKSDVQIGNVMLPISDSYRKAFREIIEKNQM